MILQLSCQKRQTAGALTCKCLYGEESEYAIVVDGLVFAGRSWRAREERAAAGIAAR